MVAGACIFCKIASGVVPSRKVLDSADCVAFLDVAPLAPGHCLLVPKQHFESLDEMPADLAGRILGQLPGLGRAILGATQSDGFNILANRGKAAGQEVRHVHVHVIPRRTGDGLGYRWQPQPLEAAAADALCRKITEALQR